MSQPTNKLRGFLIDPYKKEVHKFEMNKDLDTWYKVLQCQCVDVRCIYHSEKNPHRLDLWFDDEFLLKEPHGPAFKIAAGTPAEAIYHGYAFVAASDQEGETVSLSPEGMRQSNEKLVRQMRICWEKWERRLDPDHYLDQTMRTLEIELPGRFKFLDLPVDKGEQVR